MVDILSQNTSISGLTSSVNLHNSNETMHAISLAKIIVQSLEMLTSSEQQKKTFTTAMGNLLFRNLVIKYNYSPCDTQPVMLAPTTGARWNRTYQNEQSAVDTIMSSMSSLST